mmetsp:Transcript_29515/g.62635  ORF Transcript_29515/g.62635 Transcript_29515/m.62635 type:complete len:462 (+) Transcript_29515:110-1495(+)
MDYIRRKTKLRKPIATLVLILIACFSATYLWTEDPGGAIHHLDDSSGSYSDTDLVDGSEYSYRQLTPEQSHEAEDDGVVNAEPSVLNNFTVCGRATGPAQDLTPELQQKVTACPKEYDPETPTLVLEGYATYGRTGNQLRTIIRAMHYTRDNDLQLVIMYNSWAMDVILQFFMTDRNGDNNEDWESRLEMMLCAKIMHQPEELKGWKVVLLDTQKLFVYQSPSPQDEYVAGHSHTLRTFFHHYNTGEGTDQLGRTVRDMCSGIDSLFAKEEEESQGSAIYSVIHLRLLEHDGKKILGYVAKATGCDPLAALAMRPDYVKSILAPLDMLKHPIVVITDGENNFALQRLKADPDIGPVLRVVPKESIWFGGDVTLGVMANVFIGNPASTLSGFIGQSRKALGFGHNYLFRAKDENGGWYTVCGDDCLYGKRGQPQPVKSNACLLHCIAILKSNRKYDRYREKG